MLHLLSYLFVVNNVMIGCILILSTLWQGVIPLGGCMVEQCEDGTQKFAIRISHPLFKVCSCCRVLGSSSHFIGTSIFRCRVH